MVKRILISLFAVYSLAADILQQDVPAGSVLFWEDYASLGPKDGLHFVLPSASDQLQLVGSGSMVIDRDIQCNGTLKLTNLKGSLETCSTIRAAGIILEAKRICVDSESILDTSDDFQPGSIFVGGGWEGGDPSIQNADVTVVRSKARLLANSLKNGTGGTVVVWADRICSLQGEIFAEGKGVLGNGGPVEVSSGQFLHFDGGVSLKGENGEKGSLLLDPVSITVQASNPDIDGNGTNLDITFAAQLDNATTTPAGFPNAASVITTSALSSLLTNNVSLTLAAQNFITVDAAISPSGTNVTLTLESPTINLNSPITLASGGVLTGVGVTTVNVGASGLPQNGVDVASTGATVNLASATYTAPVNIFSKDITLNGNGPANTSIFLPLLHAVPSHSGRNPLVYVTGGSNVTIQNLTVDGHYVGFPVNANLVGIFYLNGGGTVSNCHVTRIANEPPPYIGGGQQGNGIRATINSGGPFSLTIDSTMVDLFQKAGIVSDGSPLTVTITNNTIAGFGSPIHLASNGIQISHGATGTVFGNTVSGLQFTTHDGCTGILAFNAGSNLTISNNVISGNDEGIISTTSVLSTGLIIENNTVQNSGDGGIVILDSTGDTQILSNIVTNNGGLSGPGGINAGIYVSSSTTQTFEIEQNTITPAPGASAIQVEGTGSSAAPNVTLYENTFP